MRFYGRDRQRVLPRRTRDILAGSVISRHA